MWCNLSMRYVCLLVLLISLAIGQTLGAEGTGKPLPFDAIGIRHAALLGGIYVGNQIESQRDGMFPIIFRSYVNYFGEACVKHLPANAVKVKNQISGTTTDTTYSFWGRTVIANTAQSEGTPFLISEVSMHPRFEAPYRSFAGAYSKLSIKENPFADIYVDIGKLFLRWGCSGPEITQFSENLLRLAQGRPQ